MAEFESARGQIEGLWNTAMKDAELQGRKAGAAAAVETVWQAGERLAGEWDEDRAPRRTYKSFLQELKQSVGGLPALQLTPEEWARVEAALGRENGRVQGRDRETPWPEDFGEERLTAAEWEARNAIEGVPHSGIEVGDVAAPLSDQEYPPISEAQSEEEAAAQGDLVADHQRSLAAQAETKARQRAEP